MIFASIRSSDIPWRPGQRVKIHATTLDGKPASVVVRDLPQQHNEPNPILVWLRAIWDDPKCGTHAEIVDYMLNDPRMIDPRMHEHTPARIDHARRVLTRLTHISEGASA